MEQAQQTPINGNVDPEVFRRVWDRVMTDEAQSPIAVEPSARPAVPEEGSKPNTQQMPSSVPEQMEVLDDRMLLEQGLTELGQGMALARGLARRAGRRGMVLQALLSDYRRAARQLSAAYFLAVGKKRGPGTGEKSSGEEFALGLRELFWWEKGWSERCLQAAGQAQDTYLQQLFQRLSQTGQIHLGMIRGALEELQDPALDGARTHGVN